MIQRRLTGSLLLAVLVAGCATVQEPTPPGYLGPVVAISDSIYQEDGSKGRAFALVGVGGQTVNSAFDETRRASAGRGFGLLMRLHTRDVPAAPVRVKLRASHVTAAPIHQLASRAAGTFWEVEGDADFTPVAGARYTVRGVLDPKLSEVWIEDDQTKQKVAHVRQNP